jgi:hypothetical protein
LQRKETVVIMAKGPYSQHLIFFVMYEWGVYAGVFHYTRLKKLAREKYYSFLGPFVSFKENKAQGPYS